MPTCPPAAALRIGRVSTTLNTLLSCSTRGTKSYPNCFPTCLYHYVLSCGSFIESSTNTLYHILIIFRPLFFLFSFSDGTSPGKNGTNGANGTNKGPSGSSVFPTHSLSTANWKSEHDAKYTPIEFAHDSR